jgi:hypothetical protein
MGDITPTYQIGQFESNNDLVIETIGQINKDFSSFNIVIAEINTNNIYGLIFEKLRPLLEDLYKNRLDTFFQLMYTIDLDPNKIQRAFLKPTLKLAYDEITDIVIQREILKSATRIHYRQTQINDNKNEE